MRIAGTIPNSFVDYPGKIAMVVFTTGCNMNCWYCHNRQLIRPEDTSVLYSPVAVLSELERKRDFLDAVVISGGEPTLQCKIGDFAKSVKEIGLLVKVDTNGTNPDRLKELLDVGLADYIAMDIKAPFEKYGAVCGRKIDTALLEKSISLIIKSALDYEFRTTVVPELDLDDIRRIAGYIQGAKRFSLQQYVPTLYTQDRIPHPPSFLNECAAAVTEAVDNIRVLGVK